MPRKANFIFEVRIRIPEAFTLDSIVRSPRTFKPKDVQSACQNNELAVTHGAPPPEVVSLATYVMTDFFAMSHATGLYNRQIGLWESLSKVNSVHVNQLSTGVFHKSALSIFDFSFLDYKGKPLVSACLVTKVPEKKKSVAVLKDFISRCSGKNVAGVLFCFAAPVPEDVVDHVRRATHADEPVGKYESIMPGLNKPFDLLEMNEADMVAASHDSPDETDLRTVFQLIHPDLKKKGPVGELPKKAKRPRKKTVEAEPSDLELQPSDLESQPSDSESQASAAD
jgi:hypothetical protein